MINFWSIYAVGKGFNTEMMQVNHFVPPFELSNYAERIDYKDFPNNYTSPLSDEQLKYSLEQQTLPINTRARQQWNIIKDVYLDPRFSPLLAESLAGLPPTIIYVGEHDILRDDSLMFERALKKANVPVQMFHDLDGYHGGFWTAGHRIGLLDSLTHIFDE